MGARQPPQRQHREGVAVTTCGKNRYPSQASARKHAQRRMKDDHSVVLRVYYCNKCGFWHMTKQPDKFRARDEGEW